MTERLSPAEDRERRKQLLRDTGIAYDDDDEVEVAILDSAILASNSQDSRSKTSKRDTMKRVHEALQKRRLKTETHIEEKFDEIVANVEAAYAADAKNNTPEKIEELEGITQAHTERVLDREMQEGTSLDAIRAQKTARA